MEGCVWKLSLNGRKSGGISAFAANAGFHDYKSLHSVPLHFSCAAAAPPYQRATILAGVTRFYCRGGGDLDPQEQKIIRNMYNLKCPLI